jgi:hypothetical protein
MCANIAHKIIKSNEGANSLNPIAPAVFSAQNPRMDQPAPHSRATACTNCQAELIGKFCHSCGEKRLSRKDLSLRHFVGELFKSATHLDSKVLRSLGLLAARPGFLTVEYLRGRRKRYMRPLGLFLLVNLMYFFSIGINGARTFETPLRLQYANRYRDVVYRLVTGRLGEHPAPETRAAYEAAFDAQNHTLSKSLLVLLAPLVALLLTGLFYRRRMYYAEHLVTALHLVALMLVQNMVVGVLLQGGLIHHFLDRSANTEIWTELIEPTLWVLALAFLTFRRVYPEPWFQTLWKAAVFGILWLPAVVLYRFILFLITFYTVGF